MHISIYFVNLEKIKHIFSSWNENLAQVAQRWADQCTFSHDSYSARKTSDFEIVGQNVYLQKISKRLESSFHKFINNFLKTLMK